MTRTAHPTKHNHTSAPSNTANTVPANIMIPRLMVIGSVTVLVALGLIMVYSAGSVESIGGGDSSYSYLLRQVAWIVTGVGFCVFIMKAVDYHLWAGLLGKALLAICVLGLVATMLFGNEVLGAKRWISFGSFTLQISEFVKVSLVLMSATFIVRFLDDLISWKRLCGLMFVFVLLPLAFLYVTQSDLGTTAICIVGIMALLWIGEINWKIIVGLLAGIALFGCVAIFGTGYRVDRLIFLDPFSDPYGAGYQIIHSMYAFAQGGIFGKGLGASAEKYQYLPEAQTDFVFSILGEELGMIGAVFVIIAFLVFLKGGLQIAQQAPDRFGQMICAALTIVIVFQAFLNIGCVLDMLPTTGKPLPFLSYGGSSMWASMIMVGIILSVSRASDDTKLYQQRREDLRFITADEGASRRRASQRRSRSLDGAQGHRRTEPMGRSHTRIVESGVRSRAEQSSSRLHLVTSTRSARR